MSIDALLYRPITTSSQFEGLITPYQGQEVSLDKESDNSTTYDTLKYMDQWATKYAYQMKKVAPRLKGRDLKETVNNIYKFLYTHFQYKLDGELQNLYSPSAAWHFRTKGFDCKTYSILASTILRNLNIKHSFRMVQQAGIMPGQWSHVYVIVPENNTNYVIDATKHNNTEVIFTKKYDHDMLTHRGLASPNPYPNYGALGCACSGTPIKRNVGLGSPATMEKTIANFHLFLNELEKKGLSREVTNRMLFLVKTNIENGIDPNFTEIVKKALLPASKLGETSPFSSYTLPAMNFGTTAPATTLPSTSYDYSAPLYTSNFETPSGNFMDSNFMTGTTEALSNINVGGVNAGSAISAVTGLLTGNPLGVIGLITSLIPLEKTFGQVFANDFDLSCWGASYSEQKAKLDVEKDMPFLAQWSGLDKAANTETFNRFMLATEAYLKDAKNGQQSKYAACTRKGHALRQKTVEELRNNTMKSFADNKYILSPTGKRSGTFELSQGLPGYAAGGRFGYKNEQIPYDSYTVVPPQQQQIQPAQVAYTVTGTPVTPAQQVADPSQTYYDANGKPIANNEPVKSSSSTPLLLGGAALLALKLLI